MFQKLYNILGLPKTERLDKYKRIIKSTTASDLELAVLSYVVILKINKSRKYPNTNLNNNLCSTHELLLFMYHHLGGMHNDTVFKYLTNTTEIVIKELLYGNLLPITTLIEYLPKLYTIATIKSIVEKNIDNFEVGYTSVYDKVRYCTVSPTGKISHNLNQPITKFIGTVGTINLVDTKLGNLSRRNEILKYLHGKSTVFPIELLNLGKAVKRKGSYTHIFKLKGIVTKFIEYDFIVTSPIDWAYDDNFNICGVLVTIDNKTVTIDNNMLPKINSLATKLKVHYTPRKKVKKVEITNY